VKKHFSILLYHILNNFAIHYRNKQQPSRREGGMAVVSTRLRGAVELRRMGVFRPLRRATQGSALRIRHLLKKVDENFSLF
jgi:hypothetical protein